MRTLRISSCLFMMSAWLTYVAHAQDNATLRQAQQAYDALDFSNAITLARRALEQQLDRNDQIAAHELLGFAYGALDSTRQAVEQFRQLIFIDPDREPDVNVVSPRITSLYASALGQVLVVRRLRVDSASFVAGQGNLDIQFQLSRPARAIGRVVGYGYDAVIDTQLVAGTGRFEWSALTNGGQPVPEGDYQVIITAVEAGNEFSVPIDVRVRHAPVDTTDMLTSLPGYSYLPESEIPPRDWKPLGISVLYAGLASGAAIALESNSLGESQREVLSIGVLAVVTGFIMSVKKPDPRPVAANIRYNELLRENLAQRNAEIARNNAERRRQTRLTIFQIEAGGQ
jgi:tetratricopeptide (TPR) repeat protein